MRFIEDTKRDWFEEPPGSRLLMTFAILLFVSVLWFAILDCGVKAVKGDTVLSTVFIILLVTVMYVGIKWGARLVIRGNPELMEWLEEADAPFKKKKEEARRADPDYERKNSVGRLFIYCILATMISYMVVPAAIIGQRETPTMEEFHASFFVFAFALLVIFAVLVHLTKSVNARYGCHIRI